MSDVLYISPSYIVLADRDMRVLISVQTVDDVMQCQEVGRVKCHTAKSASTRSWVSEAPRSFDIARCKELPCHLDVLPLYSLSRSMIGGALFFYRGSHKTIRVVVMGIKTGPIEQWLLNMLPNAMVDLVEEDEQIMQPSPCLGMHSTPRLCGVVESGRNFLEQRVNGSIDLLFLDFERHQADPLCARTTEYFEMVGTKMAPGGVVVSDVDPLEIDAYAASMIEGLGLTDGQLHSGLAPGLDHAVLVAQTGPDFGPKSSADGPRGDAEGRKDGSDDGPKGGQDASPAPNASAPGASGALPREAAAEAEAWAAAVDFKPMALEAAFGALKDGTACPKWARSEPQARAVVGPMQHCNKGAHEQGASFLFISARRTPTSTPRLYRRLKHPRAAALSRRKLGGPARLLLP